MLELATDPEVTSDNIRTVPTATPTEGVGTVKCHAALTHHYWARRARPIDQSQPDRRYDQQLRTDQHVDQKAAQSLIKKANRRQ